MNECIPIRLLKWLIVPSSHLANRSYIERRWL